MDSKENNSWKEWFFEKEFSVDKCLSQYTQNSDLNTLKQDLKNYGNELQNQMTSILKTETEAIVNLAEYLTNLNSKIDNLSVPISQLKEEIRTLYDLVEGTEKNYCDELNKLKNNSNDVNNIQLKLGIISYAIRISSVVDLIDLEDLDSLERIIFEFSFQKTYIEELNLESIEATDFICDIEKKLVDKINKKFLNAFKNNEKDTLLVCLRMYDNLRKQKDAHDIFKIHVVRPAIKHLFSENYLEKCNNNIDIIYKEIYSFLSDEISKLHDIIDKNPDLNNFNFVLNSFWTEFDKQSRTGLPYITAPGNPELFQKRFISTYKLLLEIAKRSGNSTLVTQNESFQDHIKRFNLPVYFEIIFQQIASNFENDLYEINVNNSHAPKNEHNFKLKPSISLFKSMIHCFKSDVYIDQLSDQFIRLSMMLLSRYLKWFQKVIIGSSENENAIVDSIIDLNSIQKIVAPIFENTAQINDTIFKIINKNMWGVLLKIFKVNYDEIKSVKNVLRDKLSSLKFKQCANHLQHVGSIPRIYRRTNRSPPKESSQYMTEAVKYILEFYKKYGDFNVTYLDNIIDDIIVDITKHYINLVQDVLLSVCKTEESLRRLKSRNVNTVEESNQNQPETMSDEVKIREQIKLDVKYFLEQLQPLASETAKDAMEQLKKSSC